MFYDCISGKVYDVTGNYVVPFLAAGVLFLVAFVFVFVVRVQVIRMRSQGILSKPQISPTASVQYHAADTTAPTEPAESNI